MHNIPYDTIIRIVYIPSDNGWLGDPTHGFPRLFTNGQGAGIGFFPQRFKKLNLMSKFVKKNHKKCWVPTCTNHTAGSTRKVGDAFRHLTGGDLEEHTDRK